MRTKLAPLAMLFGLLTALLLGSTATAQAGPAKYECNQDKAVNVVTCNAVLNDVTVIIKGNKVLNDNEIIKVEDTLNNTKVNVEDIKVGVVNVYKSFNHFITVKDVNVCILAVCK